MKQIILSAIISAGISLAMVNHDYIGIFFSEAPYTIKAILRKLKNRKNK